MMLVFKAVADNIWDQVVQRLEPELEAAGAGANGAYAERRQQK